MEGQQHFISFLPWVDFAEFGPNAIQDQFIWQGIKKFSHSK
jgi:hypothetical protein